MSKELAAEVLEQASAFFRQGPHTWTQTAFARNAAGEAVDKNAASATAFCLMGKIEQLIAGRKDLHRFCLGTLFRVVGCMPWEFNDRQATSCYQVADAAMQAAGLLRMAEEE